MQSILDQSIVVTQSVTPVDSREKENEDRQHFLTLNCKKNLHRNRSQVQVSPKVTAQIEHLNITVTLDLFCQAQPKVQTKASAFG